MDGRLESDHIWCFYVSNIANHHYNYKQGSYFVSNPEKFAYSGATQEQISNGDNETLERMSWFCKSNIPGSDAWWRSETDEVHSWIDYDIKEGHGPQTHFITLSCKF